MLQLPFFLVLVYPPAGVLAAMHVPVPVGEYALQRGGCIVVMPSVQVGVRGPRVRGEAGARKCSTVTQLLKGRRRRSWQGGGQELLVPLV